MDCGLSSFEHQPAQSSNLLVLQPWLRHINLAASEESLSRRN
jgi:hypothetical protein